MPKPTAKPTKPAPRPVKVEAPPAKKGERTFESFAAAVAYLEERVNVERARPTKLPPGVFKLERMHALMAELGDPQRGIGCLVHVAGSKGKGSTCEMVAACLKACGYTTGLYTSPHLVSLRERIKIDDAMIGEVAFARLASRVAAAAQAVAKKHGEATFFELTTAIALCHFADEAVDVGVVEVGLGGRLDATNVITPSVCAVTAIQLEHTALLGDTLEKIAAEKAGIFKPGAPAITVPQKPGVEAVLRECAAKAGTTLEVLGKELEFSHRYEASAELGQHARVCISTKRSEFEHLPVPLKGEHQAFNCGLALAILDKLRERGFETPERLVAEGLARTPNHGRMELIAVSPRRILVDGAHNPESIDGLVRAIGMHMKSDSTIMIFGCAADKDVPGMLAKLARGADKIIFTKAQNTPRAMEPRELARRFNDISTRAVQIAPNIGEALKIARKAAQRDDLICVTGSFYLAGEAKAHVRRESAALQ